MPQFHQFTLQSFQIKSGYQPVEEGFEFELINKNVPTTVTNLDITLDGFPVAKEFITLQVEGKAAIKASKISSEKPLLMGESLPIRFTLNNVPPKKETVFLRATTLEYGLQPLLITDYVKKTNPAPKSKKFKLPGFLRSSIKAKVSIDAENVIGEINPFIYGQFLETNQSATRQAIWKEDGEQLRDETLRLVQNLHPPFIRFPAGESSPEYHWEDPATSANSMDQWIDYCRKVGAELCMVVNATWHSAAEIANWVAYCNQPAEGEQGKRRAAQGYPEPHQVKFWEITSGFSQPDNINGAAAEKYIQKLRPLIEAMRETDPQIKIIAQGSKILEDVVNEPGKRWNEAVLQKAGDLIDYLAFSIYQPDQSDWWQEIDADTLHKIITAAPLDLERIIARVENQIRQYSPHRQIKLVLNEWNLGLAPTSTNAYVAQPQHTLRDALYVAGVLNVFQRHCDSLKIASLAQMMGRLPLIIANEQQAFASPIYYPFMLYHQMETISLKTEVQSPKYSTPELGNISRLDHIPEIEVAATRSKSRRRLVISVINRNPERRVLLSIQLKGFNELKPQKGWLLKHEHPDATNGFKNPTNVVSKEIQIRPMSSPTRFTMDLPPASLSLISLED